MTSGKVEIGAVARELGIAPSTLRTWERRYNLVVPQRGPNGERLYDSEQIVLLRRVLAQIRRGVRASHAHNAALAVHPRRTARLRLDPDPDAPQLARAAVDELVADCGHERFAFYLRLVASELVKNAVLYGSSREPIRLEMSLYPNAAELRVQNAGSRLRVKSLRTQRPDGGRGLEIVDALAESLTIDTGPLGTRVSVRLPMEPAA
jgi:DNA-binding transcriptional MerR regulator